MSLLNSKLNQFAIWLPKDFIYPEVRERWTPIVNRLKLQYQTLEDFLNASVQAITFPEVILNPVVQPQTQFAIKYRGGKELEPILDKNITITFKLTEGFITYWMLFDQIEAYQKYQETSPFWSSVFISFLDHHGFELMAFEFQKIVPNRLSQLPINYATVGADFTTFTLNLIYNRYKITRRLSDKVYNAGVSE
jgi:hypothetical protein